MSSRTLVCIGCGFTWPTMPSCKQTAAHQRRGAACHGKGYRMSAETSSALNADAAAAAERVTRVVDELNGGEL